MNGRLISRGGNAHSRGAGGSNPQQPLLLQRSTTFKFTVNPAAVQQQQQGNSTLLSHLGQQPDIGATRIAH